MLAGSIHDKVPDDLADALSADGKSLKLWQDLTVLGRNEYICWVESPKKSETRVRRIKRTVEELHQGMKRPCCWIGCIHRTDKDISPSVKRILNIK